MNRSSHKLASSNETHVTIKKIGAGHRKLVLTDIDGMDWTFEVVPDAQIWIDDQTGCLEDLKKGEEVSVVFAFRDDASPIAKEIRCTRRAQGPPQSVAAPKA